MPRIALRIVAASLPGGLLMGYGARIAYGCNIGAYFSAIAWTSLHGRLWRLAALLGTPIGVGLRTFFGVDRQIHRDLLVWYSSGVTTGSQASHYLYGRSAISLDALIN